MTREETLEAIKVMQHYADGGEVEQPCKTHPDAPHGFLRQASHAAGRYVCECEHWEPEE